MRGCLTSVWKEQDLLERESNGEKRLGWRSTCDTSRAEDVAPFGEGEAELVAARIDTTIDRPPKRFISDLTNAGDYCTHSKLLKQVKRWSPACC